MQAPPSTAAFAETEPAELRIAAERDGSGEVLVTWLVVTEEGLLCLRHQTAVATSADRPDPLHLWPLPPRSIAAVFARYGKPLDEGVVLPEDAPALRCPPPEAGRVRALCYRPFGWVQPLDYLVLERPGEEPACVPAPLLSAALLWLARAAAGAAG